METTSPDENTYVADSESPVEMARLINLDRIATQSMGGPLAVDSPHCLRMPWCLIWPVAPVVGYSMLPLLILNLRSAALMLAVP